MSVEANIQKLEPGTLVELYTLDGSALGADVLNFHSHLDWGSIWWQGVEYKPWPLETEGFIRAGDRPPTPLIRVANIEGTISLLCLNYDDMLGSKLTRRRTFGEFLDSRNFVGDNLITNGTFAKDLTGWTVNDPVKVKWEENALSVTGDGVVAGTAYQQINGLIIGKKYRVRFAVEDSAVTVNCGTTPAGGEYIASAPRVPGAHDLVFTATDITAYLRFSKQVAAAARVHAIHLQEIIPNPTEDTSEEFPQEIWYLERKTAENNQVIEFELASALDVGGVQLPRRQIVANYCHWKSLGGYRGPYCGYTGPPVARADGTPTDVLAEDDCGGKLSDCKLRQWSDGVLNFGSYPAASLVRT